MIPLSAGNGSARSREEGIVMFGFGKRKLVLAAPVAGRIIDIEEGAREGFSAT